MMHDKLDVIWDKDPQKQKELATSQSQKKSENALNQYRVRMDLEKLKANRSRGNKQQIRCYNRMLELVNARKQPMLAAERGPDLIQMHEKEREFMDALRLIIQNGYELKQPDFLDILRFIKFYEMVYFEIDEQDSVIHFLKEAARLLEFTPSVVDEAIDEMLNEDYIYKQADVHTQQQQSSEDNFYGLTNSAMASHVNSTGDGMK